MAFPTQDQFALIVGAERERRAGTLLVPVWLSLLDDQLTQTDIHRMAWLRDLIREVTGRIQVIVFTCRASDYLLPEEMQGITRGAAVQVIDLAQAIDRGTAPRVAAAGG